MTIGKPVTVRAARVLVQVAAILVLAGCPNMISMDELAAAVAGDVTANAAKLVVTQGPTTLASGSGSYNFGSVVADGMVGNFQGSAITFTLTNGGGTKSSLTVNSVSLSGANASDFVLSGPGATTLAYNASTSFTITYDPNAIGSSTATVTVASTDPTTPSYTFAASGTGAAFSVPSAQLTGGTFTLGYPTNAGTEAQTTASDTLTTFRIGTTEITYQTWSRVKAWAEAQPIATRYSFANAGTRGKDGTDTNPLEPVTSISWRDAIAWSNAASELAGLVPVYYNTATHTNPTNVYRTVDGTAAGVQDIEKNDGTNNNACIDLTLSGFRLPTEAEWEYAARSGGTTRGDRASGDASSNAWPLLDSQWTLYGWYSFNSGGGGGTTSPVGAKSGGTLGIYDMSGNVYEWVWDWHATYAAGTNPLGPTGATGGARVFRGGAYSSASSELATSFRDSLSATPTATSPAIGFRIAWR